MARRRNKGQERGIAAARLDTLARQARREALGPDRDLADRYVGLARRLATRYQMRLPAELRAASCKVCGVYRTAATSRTRIHAGRIVRTCICGDVRRRPLESS